MRTLLQTFLFFFLCEILSTLLAVKGINYISYTWYLKSLKIFFSLSLSVYLHQKYPSQPLYDAGITGPGPNSFFDNSHISEKDVRDVDKSAQPKATHYLNSNCVLFTYFTGETAAVVDEHFSRALSQPSSYTLDKPPPSNKPYSRSGRCSLYSHCFLHPFVFFL